jgi:hypothetical protein
MRDGEPEKKIETSEADQRGQGQKPEAVQASGSNFPGCKEQAGPKQPDLIERMLERGNMLKALQAVEANRVAVGIDGMEVSRLRRYLREHWAETREQILNGTYEPRPVRRVDIYEGRERGGHWPSGLSTHPLPPSLQRKRARA